MFNQYGSRGPLFPYLRCSSVAELAQLPPRALNWKKIAKAAPSCWVTLARPRTDIFPARSAVNGRRIADAFRKIGFEVSCFKGVSKEAVTPLLRLAGPSALLCPSMNLPARLLPFAYAAAASLAFAGEPEASKVIPLWPTGNPGGWSVEGEEIREEDGDIIRIRNVNNPELTYFAPSAESTGQAMIVCPGGGYNILAIDHEGWEIAQWLAERGVHAFVLKYRLPRKDRDPSRHHAPLQDAQRALRLVRAGAAALEIDPARIGIMGFSAGGHLAAAAAVNAAADAYAPVDEADEVSGRPDFAALIYPAYLISGKDDPVIAPELPVGDSAPPVFFAHTGDDPIPAESSIYFYLALRKAGVPAELHLYPKGGHGYGLRNETDQIRFWPERMLEWMRSLPAPPAED